MVPGSLQDLLLFDGDEGSGDDYKGITWTKPLNSIASRAAQSNSVYVSVLKIPIVHADSVSKSLCQNFFSRERSLLARGKIFYFATIMDANRDSAHQSQNEDNFATSSLGLEFLNEAEKETASAPSRCASLSECEMQQILTERHSDKIKQMTNWSVK